MAKVSPNGEVALNAKYTHTHAHVYKLFKRGHIKYVCCFIQLSVITLN